MPCYSVNQLSIDFQAGDRTLLDKAAAALGLQIVEQGGSLIVQTKLGSYIATLQGDKATCEANKLGLVNSLRVQYSKEIVAFASKKLGWQKVPVSANKLKLKKGV